MNEGNPGESPMRSPLRSPMRQNRTRFTAPPHVQSAWYQPGNSSFGPVRLPMPPPAMSMPSPTHQEATARDQRKMRPLHVSDSGMTAVLAIREHAAVIEHARRSRRERYLTKQGEAGGKSEEGKSSLQTAEDIGSEHIVSVPDEPIANIPEGEGHDTMGESLVAHMHYLPSRADVPAGVIVLRGSGNRIMFSGCKDAQDINAELTWYKPKKLKEARGKVMVLRREAVGEEFQDLINMRRQLMSNGVLAMVVVQADSDAPAMELPEGDGSEPFAIPVLFAKDKTLEREAKNGVGAMLMFDAMAGAQEFVTEALKGYIPNLILLQAEHIKSALNEHDVPYVLPEVHRKIAKSLNTLLQEKIQNLNAALASLQSAMNNAMENFAAAQEDVAERIRVSDGRVLYLDHVIQDMQSNRIKKLLEEVQKEKQHAKTLEEQLYSPEVQAVLRNTKTRKPRKASVADFFDSGRMKQPGKESMPMPLGKAADIIGHTKPGDLAAQADFLVGQAAELAGSEDADVIRIQAKLRLKENTKWFNQWFNLINWRTMSKVIKEGTLPLQQPNSKAFRTIALPHQELRTSAGSTGLPSISHRGPQDGKGLMTQSRLSTPQSVQSSVAPSTPDSALAMNLQLSSQLEMTVKMQEETVRSFIVELKAQEQECEHWRKVVDEMRQRVKALQKDLEDEKIQHRTSMQQSEEQANQRDLAARATLLLLLEELANAFSVLEKESESMQELQDKSMLATELANLPSRGAPEKRGKTHAAASGRRSTPPTPVAQSHGRSKTSGDVVTVKKDGTIKKDGTMTSTFGNAARGACSAPEGTIQKDMALLSEDEAVSLFQQIDVNGNGEISQIEFIKAIRKDSKLAKCLGLPSEIRQEEESRNLFALKYANIDSDESKSISLAEFVVYYTQGEGGAGECTEMLALEG